MAWQTIALPHSTADRTNLHDGAGALRQWRRLRQPTARLPRQPAIGGPMNNYHILSARKVSVSHRQLPIAARPLSLGNNENRHGINRLLPTSR